MDAVRIKASDLGFEKLHNCKQAVLQSLQLFLLFQFFSIGNSTGYAGSALSKMFNCNKDMFCSQIRKNCIDWREIFCRISVILLRCLSNRALSF
jgi:hypothetical protein